MGIVHRLKGDAGVIAIKIAVLNQVFDCIDNLQASQNKAKTSLESIIDLLQKVCLL